MKLSPMLFQLISPVSLWGSQHFVLNLLIRKIQRGKIVWPPSNSLKDLELLCRASGVQNILFLQKNYDYFCLISPSNFIRFCTSFRCCQNNCAYLWTLLPSTVFGTSMFNEYVIKKKTERWFVCQIFI